MVATYQVHVLGVLNLERQQQADGLQRVRPPVHIVTCQLQAPIVVGPTTLADCRFDVHILHSNM